MLQVTHCTRTTLKLPRTTLPTNIYQHFKQYVHSDEPCCESIRTFDPIDLAELTSKLLVSEEFEYSFMVACVDEMISLWLPADQIRFMFHLHEKARTTAKQKVCARETRTN